MGIITAPHRATVRISKLIHVKGSECLLPVISSLSLCLQGANQQDLSGTRDCRVLEGGGITVSPRQEFK